MLRTWHDMSVHGCFGRWQERSEGGAMRGRAVGAVAAQATQAAVSLALQVAVVRLLGVPEYGRFAVLYGSLVVTTGILTGLVGDSLVVLDRSRREIRAGLELVLLVVAGLLAAGAAVIVASSGFGGGLEAVTFGLLLLAFGVEEIVRRLLMANLAFARVILADLAGFVVVAVVVVAAQLAGILSLGVVLTGLAVGQMVGCVIGWRLVPREDRHLVDPRGADWRSVWRYGAWRALQQVLRPGLFALVRVLVLGAVGVAAVGMLEAARTYASPLTLVVGGLSSFLFVRFARGRGGVAAASVREADRIVRAMLALTVLLSVVALVLSPWAAPFVFGVHVDPLAILAWLAYGVSVALVTPYGALGAVTDRQVGVLLVRAGDTVLAVLVALAMLRLGLPVAAIPLGLALASAIGGLALRRLVVVAARPAGPPSG